MSHPILSTLLSETESILCYLYNTDVYSMILQTFFWEHAEQYNFRNDPVRSNTPLVSCPLRVLPLLTSNNTLAYVSGTSWPISDLFIFTYSLHIDIYTWTINQRTRFKTLFTLYTQHCIGSLLRDPNPKNISKIPHIYNKIYIIFSLRNIFRLTF